jgi:hypothetical protein
MDSRRFDALVRVFVGAGSRRDVARRLAAVAGLGLVARPQPAAAVSCGTDEYVCGSGSGATATCCPFFNACCQATGQCCARNQICFRGPDNAQRCLDSCPVSQMHCGGDGECCPFFGGTCCGADGKICCGPGDTCFRPGNGEPPRCQRNCAINELRCANGAGDCCPVFGGVCCGVGSRTCCPPGQICDRKTSGGPSCAETCPDLFSRRCGGDGACCPSAQFCCGKECCAPGFGCPHGVACIRNRRRRRHHH